MKARPDLRAPSAAPYDQMFAYRPARELHAEMVVTARRIRPNRFAVDRLLREKSLRTLLDAAEAGARVHPGRRKHFYRAGWYATHDITGLLDAIQALRLFPPEARLAPDAAIRMAQQALTIACGTMIQREEELEPDP